MQPVENIPLRNDPTKSKGGGNKTKNDNEVENQEVQTKKERRSSIDYDAWNKYDAVNKNFLPFLSRLSLSCCLHLSSFDRKKPAKKLN